MNLVKLKAKLAGAGTCPVLTEHILDITVKLPALPDDITGV